MDSTAYKQEKEAFVANLSGSSFLDLATVFNVIPVSILLYRVIFHATAARTTSKGGNSAAVPRARWSLFLIEFICLVVPLVLSLTVFSGGQDGHVLFSGTLVGFHFAVLFLALALARLFGVKLGVGSGAAAAARTQSLSAPRKAFLDEYRAAMTLATSVCILAVDFTVFPRRLAKTETYGISLMDVGVGSFVFAGALCSRSARLGNSALSLADYRKSVLGAICTSLPLALLGFARLLSTKLAGYQEHVSEYGVHWNFFFTLAGVVVLLALLAVPTHWGIPAGFLLATVYQAGLFYLGGEDFILHAPRTSLLSMNREGIFSLCGYVSLSLVGAQVGRLIFAPRGAAAWPRFTLSLACGTGACWLLIVFTELFVAASSRRMMNMGYLFACVAYNVQLIVSLLLVSLVAPPAASPLLQQINAHQLRFFLMANVATGLVNMACHTLSMGALPALSILLLYMGALCAAAALLASEQRSN